MAKTPSLLDILALVPAQDLARAARALGLGPEALKKRVDSFESALGFKLVDRAAKALKPGQAGRLMIDHASRIFSQARDLTRDLEELAGLQAPEVAFGVDMYAAELPLGSALGRMAAANSRLRVRSVVGDFDQLAKDVLADRLEFAIADTTSAERHPTRLSIEPIGEHRVFFFVRQGHPLTGAKDLALDTILVFPLAASRLPQRVASHIAKAIPHARVDRDTGDLAPSLALDTFAVARNVVLAGDAVGIAPLPMIEADIRAKRLALIRYDAPWMHLGYGLFHLRKKALSRVAQLFVMQLRQVEAEIQIREQRSLARIKNLKQGRKAKDRRTTRPAGAARRKAPSRK